MKTLVIGAAIIDISMKVKKLPVRGGDILCDARSFSIGGCAYNVANTMNILNADFDLLVPIGQGPYGDIIKKELTSKGYEILINDLEEDNGFSIALIEPDGERTFITYEGIEGKIEEFWFEKINFNKYDNVYFEGYRAMNPNIKIVLDKIKNSKIKNIYFCPGPMINDIESTTIQKIFDMGAIWHLNNQEILSYTKTDNIKEAIQKLYSKTKNKIFVTLGKDGVAFYDGNQFLEIAGEMVQKVIDTTGAGDSHIASIISALSKGKSVEEACKIANIVASYTVQIEGPTIDEKILLKMKGF